MKNNLIAIGLITAIGLGLISAPLAAKTLKNNSLETNSVKENIRQFFTKDYNHSDLLNILAEIENDLKNDNIKKAQSKSNEILSYLNYHRNQAEKYKGKYELHYDYKGDKVLELTYGSWFGSKRLILPLVLESKPLSVDFLMDKINISDNFKKNEISNAKIRYVSYDIENKRTGIDLYRLLSSIEDGDVNHIRKNIKNIYGDILIDHDDKISIASKIRDNLIVAKFLVNNNQFKAAENTIGYTDSMMLKLIETNSDSPMEKDKIKNLRKELNKVSVISDRNYVSEWEKIAKEIENW